jgi:hypothetical protein
MHPPVTRSTSAASTGRELSLGQEALWFLQQLAPDNSAYNVSAALSLHFPVDVARMTSAVQATVSMNSMLNCVFRSTSGEIRRFSGVAGTDRVLEVHELAMDDLGVRRFALELAQRPFRLDQQLPIRVALLRRDGGSDILLMVAHHIAADFASQLLLLREVLAGYAAESAGAERVGTDTGADFDEFVRQQRKYLESRRADAARTYWRGELERAGDTGELPTDLPRPDVYTFAGSEVDFTLPADVMADVKRTAAAQNTTAFVYLFSAFQLLLYMFNGQTDHLIGYPVTLRRGRQFRESIGYFVNTLPFHARIDPDDSFDSLLRRTGKKLLSGLMHRDYPFALMPRLVEMRREPNRAGLISTMFVMTSDIPDDPGSAALVPGDRVELAGLSVSEFYLPQQQGQFDMTLQVAHHAAGAQLKYNTSLFTSETARDLAEDYVDVLRSATGGTLPPRLCEVSGRRARHRLTRTAVPDEADFPAPPDEGA